ncbi:c-type cytochrome [Planctomycetota bacterium]
MGSTFSTNRGVPQTRSTLLSLAIVFSLLASTYAQDENDDSASVDFRPGLLAEYASGNASVRQVVPVASLNDSPKNMTVRWTGRLFVRYGNRFEFSSYGCGDVTFKINSKQVLSGKNATTGWYEPATIDLDYGWHPVEIVYRTNGGDCRFGIYWSCDQFQIEPITSWFHLPPDPHLGDAWESGRRFVRELGCTNCHDVPGVDHGIEAPPLDKLPGNMNAAWLTNYLATNAHGDGGRAPALSLNREQANAVATALCGRDEKEADQSLFDGNATQGQSLFHSVGCLACHAIDRIGSGDEGRDLTDIANKRPRSFLVKWLSDPSQINEQHRMPTFDLTKAQIHDLTAYLSQQRERIETVKPVTVEGNSAERLMAANHCEACHSVPTRLSAVATRKARTRLSTTSDWSKCCVANAKENQPAYSVPPSTLDAIRAYVTTAESLPHALATHLLPPVNGRDLIHENRCFACHSRGSNNGLRDTIEQAVAKKTDLQQHISAMTPPSLNSVGDKLTDSAIGKAIKRDGSVHRPWKRVQMPQFNLDDAQFAAIVKTLVVEDRVPPVTSGSVTAEELPDDRRLFMAGSRLVTSDGFGCTSCHKIGKTEPNKAPAHLLGPDLSMLGNRVRQSWFRRWLKNPANIVPRVEMPSVQHPVRGLLDENLSHQIAATWHVLNQKRFDPPVPDAVRVVRHSGKSEPNRRAHVLTDVMRYDGHALIKPFAIGLANRHNILFDLEHGRMLDWSIGDTAKQRTQGKTWFWQWAGHSLMENERSEVAMIHLHVDGERIPPTRRGQFVSEPHSWEHNGNAVRLRRQLAFDYKGSTIHVWVDETFAPRAGANGFERTLEFSRLPLDSSVEVSLLDTAKPFRTTENGIQWKSPRGPELSATVAADRMILVKETASVRCEERVSRATVRISYTSSIAADSPPIFETSDRERTQPLRISVVPGFKAVRLPGYREIMPTAFAWNPKGELFVASLKGRVWRFFGGGEGWSDFRGHPISDELAAPFGIAAHDGYLDVINKGGLLRLIDTNGDRRPDATQTIASGWGHTDDYHDWAIGLPRDDAGNYFVSIACQQDDRSPTAAHLRGKVVKLSPREPTLLKPHLFEVSEVSGGHRFGIGIARSKEGDLFVSDNQGNFNPYNELNHVRQGLRFGFINQSEKETLANPPLTIPSINIPHPWTRSVNGICFLETPQKSNDRDFTIEPYGFGPFEGHIIGCEYDTRRLVRMSLQRVGDTFQGAVYPFSRVAVGEENQLLGPITCAVSPRGSLFIGEMRDSGWGAGSNTGQIVRLRYDASSLPCGIAEVRAVPNGFEIEFAKAIDPAKAQDRTNYEVSSATRISTPAYGGDDRNHRRESIRRVIVAKPKRGERPIVRLEIDDLRTGYVYDFHVKSITQDGEEFFPGEAYYTLNHSIQ